MRPPRHRATATDSPPRVEDLPDVLSPEQAARLLRVSVNTLYAELRAGRIPHLRVGRGIRILKEALLAAFGPQEANAPRLRVLRGSAHREG
jgi:excisionase family DNA binding protein